LRVVSIFLSIPKAFRRERVPNPIHGSSECALAVKVAGFEPIPVYMRYVKASTAAVLSATSAGRRRGYDAGSARRAPRRGAGMKRLVQRVGRAS
jgi:hypothetical protein